MADPYLGEIRLVAFATPMPAGWLPCDGRLLPVQQNQALYSIIGNTYGGEQERSFALPDLRGRAPVHDVQRGKEAGAETVALIPAQMPAHTHAMQVTNTPATTSPTPHGWYANSPERTPIYGNPDALVALAPNQLLPAGSESTQAGAGHENRQPYLAIGYIISVKGVYPPHPDN